MLSVRDRKNVAILAIAQALYMTGAVLHAILGGLAGAAMADNPALATLPITATVTGSLLASIPASLLMRRIGRRAGFQVGSLIGLTGVLMGAYALYVFGFWLFVAGAFFSGCAGGFALYYRFAAADAVQDRDRPQAISLVLTGGVLAAVIGPELARHTTDLLLPYPFLGAYLAAGLVSALALLLLAFLDVPPLSEEDRKTTGRPLSEIARQPIFLIALAGATVGYGIMSLLMTATPLAMMFCGFGVDDSAFVIQSHVLAMFAPSFFTGRLIQRFGTVSIMLVGIALMMTSVGFGLSGIDLHQFWLALVFLGLGWNFTFVGGSTLLGEAYRPSERAKAQAANDFVMFGSVAGASALSGVLLHHFSWDWVNLVALPVLLVMGAVLLLLKLRRASIV
ncbi:MAG: MFS transporter [Magnetovibrionaceae bacterium]